MYVQVQQPDDSTVWRSVPALDHGLSVHVGKGLEIQSGGLLTATTHRVLMSARKPRSSIGMFCCPHPGQDISPPGYPPYDWAAESGEGNGRFPWARWSSKSTEPYKIGPTARVDTSPVRGGGNSGGGGGGGARSAGLGRL